VFTFADKVFSFAMRVDKAGVHENDERKYRGKQKLSFFPRKQYIRHGDLVKDKNKIDEKFDAKCTCSTYSCVTL